MLIKKTLIMLTLIISCSPVFAKLDSYQQTAKDKGIMLFNQYKPASEELTIAAKAGDSEAQYFLAEEIRQQNQYVTDEAYKWYEAAAEQGDIYAMIRIGRNTSDLCAKLSNCAAGRKTPQYWLALAEKITKEQSQGGGAEALYLLYELTAERKWLEQSAQAGNTLAQYRMAIGDRQGEGNILPWKRAQSVENWFLLSAKGGNPKAMMQLFGIYREKGNLEDARYWLEQAAQTGYESAIYNYGYFLALEPDALGLKKDKIKGYALISLLKELDGGGAVEADVEDTLTQISETMNTSEIEEATAVSKEWKSKHPPLSFYPEKIDF